MLLLLLVPLLVLPLLLIIIITRIILVNLLFLALQGSSLLRLSLQGGGGAPWGRRPGRGLLMGQTYTAPADRAAGEDAHWRPLTVAQVDDALYARLLAIADEVGRLRSAVQNHGGHPAWDRRLDRVEGMLRELIDDVDHVELSRAAEPR